MGDRTRRRVSICVCVSLACACVYIYLCIYIYIYTKYHFPSSCCTYISPQMKLQASDGRNVLALPYCCMYTHIFLHVRVSVSHVHETVHWSSEKRHIAVIRSAVSTLYAVLVSFHTVPLTLKSKGLGSILGGIRLCFFTGHFMSLLKQLMLKLLKPTCSNLKFVRFSNGKTSSCGSRSCVRAFEQSNGLE